MAARPKPKRTEQELTAMLRDRYSEQAGNGEAWAFIPKVRDAAGFNARRTLDAMAMSLWPSRGLLLYGFEIKCDRRDWLRELKDPGKADAFGQMVDKFFLVVGDESIVQPGELPDPWGLLIARGKRLVQVVEPELLHGASDRGAGSLPPGIGRSFVAALLRSACRTGAALPHELAAAAEQGRADGRAIAQREIEQVTADLEECRAREKRFREIAGMSLVDVGARWRLEGELNQVEKVAAAVRAVMDGNADIDRVVKRLQGLRSGTASLIAELDQALAAYAPAVEEEPAF